jgi:hypothetical protein
MHWTAITTYPLSKNQRIVARLDRSENGTYRAVLVGVVEGTGSVAGLALHDLAETLQTLSERLAEYTL